MNKIEIRAASTVAREYVNDVGMRPFEQPCYLCRIAGIARDPLRVIGLDCGIA